MQRLWQTVSFAQNQFQRVAEQLCAVYPVSAFFCTNGKHGWLSKNWIGLGEWRSVNQYQGNPLEKLDKLISENNDWIAGHCGYDLKKEIESIDCTKANEDGFADLYFFIPEIVLILDGNMLRIGVKRESDFDKILEQISATLEVHSNRKSINLEAATKQLEYLKTANVLLENIHRGNIYEINYCVDFIGNEEKMNPAQIFEQLNLLSQAPFSVLYRNNDSWLMCASPERYIAKQGSRLFSQPIKGTRKRGATPEEDASLITELQNDKKERMENIMIVDLVRNDLSRVAAKGSVQVTELCAVYTFKTVHQMISTVECKISPSTSFVEILKATFPMGSMTGAPKIRAMQLAEEFESQSRGIYSGSVGFITPEGDFDFNVVIRSITWNAETGHISAKAGSALTSESIPEKEYEECLIKVNAMKNALKSV